MMFMLLVGWSRNVQNDLVLGWAMDFKFGACANGPPHEKIGIIDTDFVTHMSTQSLGEEVGARSGVCLFL